METFAKCVDVYKTCDNTGPLFLHNFGEPLLHAKLTDMIRYATENGVECSFFTNGMRKSGQAFERDTWKKLADAGLKRVDFSAHAISEEKFRNTTDGIVEIDKVFDPVPANLGTWAGQVGAAELPDSQPCLFQRENAFVVLWDGRISSCCLDVEGQRQCLWIDDVIAAQAYEFVAIELCASCSSMREHEQM